MQMIVNQPGTTRLNFVNAASEPANPTGLAVTATSWVTGNEIDVATASGGTGIIDVQIDPVDQVDIVDLAWTATVGGGPVAGRELIPVDGARWWTVPEFRAYTGDRYALDGQNPKTDEHLDDIRLEVEVTLEEILADHLVDRLRIDRCRVARDATVCPDRPWALREVLACAVNGTTVDVDRLVLDDPRAITGPWSAGQTVRLTYRAGPELPIVPAPLRRGAMDFAMWLIDNIANPVLPGTESYVDPAFGFRIIPTRPTTWDVGLVRLRPILERANQRCGLDGR